VHRLRAREVFGQEKAEAWELAESRWPHFPAYRAKAGREIPSCSSNRTRNDDTRDTGKPSSTEQDHEHKAGVAGWIGVGAVTLGTFTLVTNEFIPVDC